MSFSTVREPHMDALKHTTGKPSLEWEGEESEGDWEDLIHSLSEIMGKTTSWRCRGEDLGWLRMSGAIRFEANNPTDLLREILPKTECSFKVFLTDNGFSINNFHHDSPTGEWLHLTPEDV